MFVSQIGAGLIMCILIGVGCARMSSSEREIRDSFSSIPDDMPIENLGSVTFAPGTPQSFDLEGGHLSVTVTNAADGLLQVKMVYESTEKSWGGRRTESYRESSQFLLRPGMRCASKMGEEVAVILRPKLEGPHS